MTAWRYTSMPPPFYILCHTLYMRKGCIRYGRVPASENRRYNESQITGSHFPGGTEWNCAIDHSATFRVPPTSR